MIRLPWRQSAVLGALMNTRGLTELIVLNLALSIGAISQALFTALVIMALVTTFMAGPLIRLLDPHNAYGEEPEEELAASARRASPCQRAAERGHSILVAPQSAAALDQLLALAEPLARSEPRRELILARLVQAAAGRGRARRPADRGAAGERGLRAAPAAGARSCWTAGCTRARWR